MSRLVAMLSLMAMDIAVVLISGWLGLVLRFDSGIPSQYVVHFVALQFVVVPLAVLLLFLVGGYRRIWRLAGVSDWAVIIGASLTIGALTSAVSLWVPEYRLPRGSLALFTLFLIVLLPNLRLLSRLADDVHVRYSGQRRAGIPTLIYGAGSAGLLISQEIARHPELQMRVVGFVDDDVTKKGRVVRGLPVLGTGKDLEALVEAKRIQSVIFAAPSAPTASLRAVVSRLAGHKVKLRTLPGLYEMLDDRVSVNSLRDVRIEDLLGREPVKLDEEIVSEKLKGKVVLVTGAGGSIGSELCRQICRFHPKQLVLLGHGEYSIYQIHRELSSAFPALDLVATIADIRDVPRIDSVFRRFKPEIVFHAAAHKHVPLMESDPTEAISNNVYGTKTVAEAALKWNAERFVMVSTDKAVNPTSVMGATKRMAELVVQGLNGVGKTRFMAVRFGNVLGSRGSVVPLFKEQVLRGGPVSVTHPEMERYFMTIPEASQLVLQAGALGQGGEVFVLDMGKPVKIVDLACDIIRLMGFEPHKDIQIEYVGVRPGEKLYEELFLDTEPLSQTQHERIFCSMARRPERREVEALLAQADDLVRSPHLDNCRLLELAKGFKSSVKTDRESGLRIG